MRTSTNQLDEAGILLNGYDYHNQAWVQGGSYVDCGHPLAGSMTIFGEVWDGCNCYARAHAGEACTIRGDK